MLCLLRLCCSGHAITSNIATNNHVSLSVCTGYEWTSPGPASLQSSRKSISAAEGRPAGVTAGVSAIKTAAAVVQLGNLLGVCLVVKFQVTTLSYSPQVHNIVHIKLQLAYLAEVFAINL